MPSEAISSVAALRIRSLASGASGLGALACSMDSAQDSGGHGRQTGLGCPPARADRTIHMNVADTGDVAAGPVDGSHGPAQVGAEAGEAAQAEAGPVGAARPLLSGPVDLDVIDRLERSRPDVLRHPFQHLAASRLVAQPPGPLGVLTGQEGQE